MASNTEQNMKEIEPEEEHEAQIDKRQRTLTRKALQNAVEEKRRDCWKDYASFTSKINTMILGKKRY
jgi:hypothetical protein